MDDLLTDFIAETHEMLDMISGEIVAWERNPSDRERLDAIFRFVHTVKGNCGFFDFPVLAELSHAAEDALADCRANRREADAQLVSAVLAIIDKIKSITDAIEAGDVKPGDKGNDQENAQLIAALSEDAAHRVAAAPPSSALSTEAETPETLSPETHSPEILAETGEKAPRPVQSQPAARSIRLPVHLLDEMMKGVSDLVLAQNEVSRWMHKINDSPELFGSFERLSGILKQVRESVTRMRMQKFEYLFGQMPRLIRDLSQALDKQVIVDFEGGDVEIDREMIELIRDPITHIVRNAIDHGIEYPSERLALGKREIGLINFFARQIGNRIILAISDDGRGINPDAVAKKALENDLVTEQELEGMTDTQKVMLIFKAGFTTAEDVSTISGRGVGMDVVQANIERLGGSVEIMTHEGEGTTFILKVPLTLSIIPALIVRSANMNFAIPSSFVEEIMIGRSKQLEFKQTGGQTVVAYRGEWVPCASLQGILEGTPRADSDWRKKTILFLRFVTNDVLAIAVDMVKNHEEVVIKPLAPAIMESALYTGATLLDDGLPMLVLDVPGIANRLGMLTNVKAKRSSERSKQQREEHTLAVMRFTGLDREVKAVHLPVVKRIHTCQMSDLEFAKKGDPASPASIVIDGRILPVAGLSGPLDEQTVYRLLEISDGIRETAYIALEIDDAISIDPQLTPAEDKAEAEGQSLFEGQILTVLSTMHLLKNSAETKQQNITLFCSLPEGNPWAEVVLIPLLASAGYQPLSDPKQEADVAIILDENAASDAPPARDIIHLRSERQGDDAQSSRADNGLPDSIYRYDNAKLLTALKTIRQRRLEELSSRDLEKEANYG